MKTLIVILLIIFAALSAEGAEVSGKELFYSPPLMDDPQIASVELKYYRISDPVTTPYLIMLKYTCHDNRAAKDKRAPRTVTFMNLVPACEVNQESYDQTHKIYSVHYAINLAQPGPAKCGPTGVTDLDLRKLCAEWQH
jgi:hypothetical protein